PVVTVPASNLSSGPAGTAFGPGDWVSLTLVVLAIGVERFLRCSTNQTAEARDTNSKAAPAIAGVLSANPAKKGCRALLCCSAVIRARRRISKFTGAVTGSRLPT